MHRVKQKRSARLDFLALRVERGHDGVLACTRPFRDNGFEYGQFCKTELQNILKLRCESVYRGHCSEAEFEYVKRCIAECFPNAPTPQEAYTLFEDALKQFACGPLMRSAAFHGDGHFMRKWCGAPGMLISNKSFRGSMGEMPVHIAAASGNVEALRTCLDLKADPNTEDTMRERPLHYAALAGSAPAVQVLLRANADPTVRSAFLETPLDVARENAAAYLDVNTCRSLGAGPGTGAAGEGGSSGRDCLLLEHVGGGLDPDQITSKLRSDIRSHSGRKFSDWYLELRAPSLSENVSGGWDDANL